MLEALPVILSIAILELILSVDNALVNASLAEKLPHALQKKAVYVGIAMAAVFRFACLFLASIIIQNPYIKVAGAAYLIYLALSHFLWEKQGDPELQAHPHFKRVIVQIGLTDLAFSLDNIVGVIGITDNFTYLVIGVLIGILTILFVTKLMLRLIDRFPSLIGTAYVIIAYIGLSIFLEVFLHVGISEYMTFAFILSAVGLTIAFSRPKRAA